MRRATAEPELYKDKVEVSLAGRQIFYLLFGGAVIVGLVFVLGVMVGRRVEARSHVDIARTQATTDPLAALDNLESNKPQLSFQNTLTGTPTQAPVEKKIEDAVRAKADKRLDDKKAEPKKAEPEKKKKPEKKAGDAEPVNPDVITQIDKKLAEDKKLEDKKLEDKKLEDKKPRFTLQLSSFQDREEADAFLSSVKAAGYQAYVTSADVSGKGTFYRVRLGRYGSMDAANEAKTEVEKALGKSASVMKL